MHRKATTLVAAVTVMTLSAIGLARAADYKMLSSWLTNNKGTWITEQLFMNEVERISQGKVKIVRTGPEVVPPFEQLQPVAAGAFDILFTNGAYHAGSTAIGMGLDAIAPDPVKRRDAGIMEMTDKMYQKVGLRVIGMVPQGTYGYHIILRQPLSDKGDFTGKKIRGTQVYHPLIQKLGGSPVVLPAPEVYPSLEKGVIDGAAYPVVGALDLRWYEVAKYYLRPAFGVSTSLLLMNANKWRSAPDSDKAVLLEAAKNVENEIFKTFDKLAVEEADGLRKNGMQEIRLAPDREKEIGKYWEEGVWALVRAKNGADADALRKLAADKGLGM